MPIYELKCPHCGKQEERKLKITDDEPQLCPECGNVMDKLISKSDFHLHGTGWAKNGY